MGYSRAGFTDIVGVDVEPMPRYPFAFVRAEAMDILGALVSGGGVYVRDELLPLSAFDAIHASPPCQRYSVSQKIHDSGHRHPDLVEPCRELLGSAGLPWVMENVVGAPMENAVTLCGLMFGLRVLRHRQFESNLMLMVPPHPKHPPGDLTGSCKGYSTGANGFVTVAGNNFVKEAGAKAMGIDWMTDRRELAQAIPPAFTTFVGRQVIDHIRHARSA